MIVADVVVVGAGLAGVRMCAELRAVGYSGSLLVLGAESQAPYDRPPLTKDPDEDVDLRSAMGLDVWALADEVRLGVRVERIDRMAPAGSAPAGSAPADPAPDAPGPVTAGWRLTCSDGSQVSAGTVVVATGADPVLAAGWERPGVHVLHTRSGAAGFWAQIEPGVRLAVIGGGWVGCEAAATAANRGAHVRLVEARPKLLDGRVPDEVATRVTGWLAAAGVGVQCDASVDSVSVEDSLLEVLGTRADIVLAALGVRPATAWLAGAGVGLAADGSVRTDAWGRSDTAGLFALGDAAARWSDRAGTHLPGGHWTQALNAPAVLAPAVAAWATGDQDPTRWSGAPGAPGVPAPDPIAYVFSEIAGRRLLTLGDPAGGRVVWRESASAPVGPEPPAQARPEAWTAFTVDRENRLVGVCTVGRPRDLAAARRAMLADPCGTPRVDPVALADPTAPAPAMFLGQG